MLPYRKNHEINEPTNKKLILKYLYNSGYTTKHIEFQDIVSDENLMSIRTNSYVVCPIYNGTRCWILFFKNMDDYFAVSFPKHSAMKQDQTNIFKIKIPFKKIFYDGTIMEGIYYRDDISEYIIIDEVFKLCGEDMMLKTKQNRMTKLSEQLKTSASMDTNYKIHLTKIYETDKFSLENMYNDIIKDDKIYNIVFYPNNFGKPIYRYSLRPTDKITQCIETTIFVMQSTSKPDVYNLLLPVSLTKHDIAYIPNLQTSKICKTWFGNKRQIMVKCKHDILKKKWIPIEKIQ